MTPHNLFLVIVRVIGLFFLKDLLLGLLQFVPLLSTIAEVNDLTLAITILVSGLIGIGLYVIVPYFFLYRTEWLVAKLRLTEGIAPGVLPLAIHRSTVLSIAIIVVGGLLLAEELPNLGRQLFLYSQERENLSTHFSGGDYLLFIFLKVVTGGLLISNQRRLVAFIESRRKS